MTSATPPPGWYPDPADGATGERYWDGFSWTHNVRAMMSSPMPPQPAMRIAPWGWRILAWLIDFAILYLPLLMVQNQIWGGRQEEFMAWTRAVVTGRIEPVPDGITAINLQIVLATAGVWLVYRIVMIGWRGATLGKMILKMRVIKAGDQSLAVPSWKHAIIRGLAAVVFLTIPLIRLVTVFSPLFNERRQALHDRIADTLVLIKN